MIRLTQEQGKNLLLLLLCASSMNEVYETVVDENGEMNWTDKERELRNELLDTLILHDRESLIDDIVMQLKDTDEDGNVIGGDLIEVIARVIQNPFARNRLGTAQLNQLRRAILLPNEIAKLNNEIEEFHCVQCQREPMEDELFVRRNDNSFICSGCAGYAHHRCSTQCDRTTAVNLKRSLPKCEEHR